MKEHDKLWEDYEDAYFALLMEKVAEQEGQCLAEWNEELKNDPSCAVPKETDEKCLQTISNYFAKQKKRSAARRVFHYLRTAGIAALIASLLFSVAYAVSEDVRVTTRNLIISVQEKYTEFHMESSRPEVRKTSANVDSFEYFEHLQVGWIPEGFGIYEYNYNRWINYEDSNEQYVRVILINAKNTFQLDTENAKVSETTIHELPAIVVQKCRKFENFRAINFNFCVFIERTV